MGSPFENRTIIYTPKSVTQNQNYIYQRCWNRRRNKLRPCVLWYPDAPEVVPLKRRSEAK